MSDVKCLMKLYMVASESFTLWLHILQVAIILFGSRSLNSLNPKAGTQNCNIKLAMLQEIVAMVVKCVKWLGMF